MAAVWPHPSCYCASTKALCHYTRHFLLGRALSSQLPSTKLTRILQLVWWDWCIPQILYTGRITCSNSHGANQHWKVYGSLVPGNSYSSANSNGWLLDWSFQDERICCPECTYLVRTVFWVHESEVAKVAWSSNKLRLLFLYIWSLHNVYLIFVRFAAPHRETNDQGAGFKPGEKGRNPISSGSTLLNPATSKFRLCVKA